MKEIKEVDSRTLDFEGYDDIYRYEPKHGEQDSEENYDVKYFKVTESYENGGF